MLILIKNPIVHVVDKAFKLSTSIDNEKRNLFYPQKYILQFFYFFVDKFEKALEI